MGNFIQRIFRKSLARKVRSIKNEQDLIRLFEQYLFLNHSTKDEVVGFLQSNQLLFEVSNGEMQPSRSFKGDNGMTFEEIIVFLVGPPVWDRLFPFGSQYYVRFHFMGNILSTISAFHIVNHF